MLKWPPSPCWPRRPGHWCHATNRPGLPATSGTQQQPLCASALQSSPGRQPQRGPCRHHVTVRGAEAAAGVHGLHFLFIFLLHEAAKSTLQASWICVAALLCVHDCSYRAARRTLQHSVEYRLQQQVSVLPGRRERPAGQHCALSAKAGVAHVNNLTNVVGPCSGCGMPVVAGWQYLGCLHDLSVGFVLQSYMGA